MSKEFTADGYHSMDVTFNNVLEGTRQYFLGVPKPAQPEGSGQPVWPAGAPPPEEGTPAQSGAPAPSSRPPSAAAAPPAAPPTVMAAAVLPRPPSEPIEPEPHIIHKATVMREAAEKRREMPEVEDEEDPIGTLSPPSHIIRKPPRTLPSPAPAPAVPCPSPARPPSAAPLPPAPAPEAQLEPPSQYRTPLHRVPTPTARPPDHYTPGRPPDPYSSSRPPESYMRYHYETNLQDGGRSSHGAPNASPQPTLPARHSPQTYARLSGSLPQHSASRLRDTAAQSPPTQRYVMPVSQPPPPHNDRVPPIHHPQAALPPQRLDVRSTQPYSSLQHRRESSPYGRVASHYDRHPAVPTRKYDPQQAYPGYRPAPTTSQSVQNHRIEPHHSVAYKHPSLDVMNAHYPTRPTDRMPAQPQLHSHDNARLPPRAEYPSMSRTADVRSGYHYSTPSTSTARYPTNAQVPVVQNTTHQSRSAYREGAAPKTNYEYSTSSSVQTSPARSAVKPGYANQQTRMTVSVTSIVNQMNQTKQKHDTPVAGPSSTSQIGQPKQKRESPLDLSVKTVKNSADSSTTQDDVIDSASMENKTLPLQTRPASNSRQIVPPTPGYMSSHKVDFAPNFTQYRERSVSQANINMAAPSSHPVRYNGAYETARRPVAETYPVESQHHTYPERNKYGVPPARPDYVHRIDLTRPTTEQRHDGRIRDDRPYTDERKRQAGPIVSNIPEKIVRYETWTSDSRIEQNMNQLTREQNELISRPVYSYSSYKQFEAYQKEQRRPGAPHAYHDHHNNVNHRYPNQPEAINHETSDYHAHHYHDRSLPNSSRHHVIQKIPNHRDIHPHHLETHSGVPADKRVLSILRNSLETKQTGYAEAAKPPKPICDLIIIDDVDDSVIEITDLTKDTDSDPKGVLKTSQSQIAPNISNHIQMPRAVDSIIREPDHQKQENIDSKSKSPENDVASRIRTKAELKVMPPSQDNNIKPDVKQNISFENDRAKQQPKSQKQHLFNQIREDNLRLESVIKSEKPTENIIPEVKSEPMNIDEIEKDAEIPIKTENILDELEPPANDAPVEDLDWANACDSFMEQLKVGCHKKRNKRRRDTMDHESEQKTPKNKMACSPNDKPSEEIVPNIVIKQEPLDLDESEPLATIAQSSALQDVTDKSTLIDQQPEIITKEKEEDSIPKDKKQESNTKDMKQDPKLKDKKQDLSTRDKKQDSTMKDKKQDPTIKDKKPDPTVKDKQQESVKDKTHLVKDKKQDSPVKNKIQSSIKEKSQDGSSKNKIQESKIKEKAEIITEKTKYEKKNNKDGEKSQKLKSKTKSKSEKIDTTTPISVKKEPKEKEPIKTVIKEEAESTDDDEPLIKSKLLKEKEKSDQLKYQLLKDLSEKSAYVKLECCDVDVNKNTRKSLDSSIKDKEDKLSKNKLNKQTLRSKGKASSVENNKAENDNEELSTDSDDDDLSVSVASRLRMRKIIKSEDGKPSSVTKTPVKSSPQKKQENNNNNASSSSTPIRKPGFGDGSDFHPGWEEELYRYKRSLRMPTRLIAIPRGRSGGPFPKGSGAFFTRGSTSLPDLDPAPLSPAPSSAPSAATDDLYARRPDKLTLDSDLESNSSSSAANRLHYDSEASTSTVFSTSIIKKKSSIVDVLIQKCGSNRKEDSKKKSKENKDDKNTPKVIPKSTNPSELLPTPSLGLVKNGSKGNLSAKKEKLMEDIFYLGAFRKETVSAFRNAFINNTDGLIGATEEFSPVVLKSRTRTESRVLKQRATIKEVFGDERPASAPPSSCREEEPQEEDKDKEIEIKKEPDTKPKFKPKKIVKDKMKRRSNSIRDGLRSTKSLKRNDAKGRLLRLKKRNSLMKSLATKRIKDGSGSKIKKENSPNLEDKDNKKDESTSLPNVDGTKRRLKRLFGRRKFSSGFDYIRKKKKIIRREDANNTNKVRRPAAKPSPESIHDIHKEIKSWFINKSIGETHLHRAARLGYTDCVAYCLEKMEADPSAKDNAGFTPLHVAAAKGHVRIARLLLQYGANVSAAAQGGIRPLHEACENTHVEVIRLLLSYGADPLLGTYAGQTPEELAEGPAAMLIRLHLSDVQGHAVEPWRFPHPAEIIDREEIGCDPLSSPPPCSPPPPPPDATIEIQTTDAPLPPFYTLRTAPGQPGDGLWCLLQDITNLLQIKSKDSLLKQIHCGSGSPKELLREIRTQEFLERAQCQQLLCAGEKVNVRASKVALVRVTDKLRQLLKIETVLVS
ncbi:uncharacterized protein LOC114366706 [Ostrinia furnacalis]|uniref:uncharacterized protein LOC114366706 n=1 Tax=Ostrinia furnacalis TaxID=93504 RepID=UPI00103D00CD|nr:uncharacterized protein LOC114366706 [Ostrinia furnacalis]XP_028179452.1 uncharacterized protein LOC114366706 [Ostrinia furnacalis]XP_028179453.1 uncharacterized protein LOC114366706 [Ostrinia furnacalis]XP_028179455.1 uncharacterized protein LOC114366706 [Ostrinia furnacalis]XP_028179456.1 uncharacterized protein LOC114366706 [Ostrinia furnacalis]